ncbi:MAG TPA: PT domain-containing protein [Candidatus Limnocylindrales bacterium]|nr:PT domain-containing protein [Candidatus Limnocylindrales bacterium]
MKGSPAVAIALLITIVVACQATSAPIPTMQPSPALTPEPTGSPRNAPTSSPPMTGGPTSSLPVDPRTAGWRSDLATLISAREDMHPNPWHSISRDDYVAEVDSVIARIPELDDDELFVELTRLAALPNSFGRDGHGGTYPWGEGDYGVSMYPLRLYWFSDGVFVTDALAEHRDLVGARVDAIAGHDIDELLNAVEPLVSRDNQQQVLSSSPLFMLVANILHGLGFVPDATSAVEFTLTRDGEVITDDLEPVPMSSVGSLLGGHYFWSVPPRSGGPLWLSNLDDEMWFEVDADSSTLFVGYNAVGAGLYFDIDDLTGIVDSGDVDRMVIDVRHNGGGDNSTFGPLLDLVARAADELTCGVYVAMGRATFSAAGNFVTDVDRDTNAVLVGEDLGTSPNQYGDGRPVDLTHSGAIVRFAVQYVVRSDLDDPRLTIEPDIEAPLSSSDYFGDRDPVLEAIHDQLPPCPQ